MSPMDGQKEFRGATPGYEGYAYREDAQVAAREKGTTRGMLGYSRKWWPKSIAGGVGEDIFTPGVDGNRSQRLWPVETCRPSSANRDLYTGGGLGLMGHVSRPDARAELGIGGQTPSFFAKHSGVHSPTARV